MKQLRLTLSEAAAADIVEQADWYEQQSGPALAKRWEKAVTSAVLRIADRPRAGAVSNFRHAELVNVRRILIAGFRKHLIFSTRLRRTALAETFQLNGRKGGVWPTGAVA